MLFVVIRVVVFRALKNVTFENISVNFSSDEFVGQIQEDGGDRRSGLASTTTFLKSSRMHGACAVRGFPS